MSPFKNLFGLLQKVGKAVMLPVSVLPVAGILLGVGAKKLSWLPGPLSRLMEQAGGAIFTQLPLLFAVGVAIGLAGGDGVAALAATVGYFVLMATLAFMARHLGVTPESPGSGELQPFIEQVASHFQLATKEVNIAVGTSKIDTGVVGGILVGAMAAYFYKRYYRIELPPYLGFFAGKRFVPIITAFGAIALGILLSFVWPPVGRGIDTFSAWATEESTVFAVFIFGLVERSLIPFGLHHIWNVPFYFEMGSFTTTAGEVVHGDVTRFMKGDSTAGILGGAYLFKMWGLPGAAMAMWHTARPSRRKMVGGIMISAALTSFLTGITEPIEFSFLFCAPLLYALHAVLAGLAFSVFNLAGGLMGTTFSHGLIDFVLLYSQGTKAYLVLILGPIFALLYYTLFRFLILRLDIKTPGREDEVSLDSGVEAGSDEFSRLLVLAFGGRSNIAALDACITRLRVSVNDQSLASAQKLKALGASGVLTVGDNLQAIFGPRSENLKSAMEAYLRTAGDEAELSDEQRQAQLTEESAVASVTELTRDARAPEKARAWLEALGGFDNIRELEACAATRLRVVLEDPSLVSSDQLEREGVRAVMPVTDNQFHLIVGQACEQYLREMKKRSD